MTDERKAFIIQMALSYLLSNLDDAIDAYGHGPQFNNHAMRCKVQMPQESVVDDSPTEAEIKALLEG